MPSRGAGVAGRCRGLPVDMIASLLGGLGLFLLGVKALSGQLAALAGVRMRSALARGTSNASTAALLGLVLGGGTQSSNAVTFIAASMRSAGLVGTRRMLPLLAWANVGTAGLVLVASFDLRFAALWLLALCGALTYFGLDRSGRLKPLLSAVTGLGLMLLGLALVKAGALPLREWPLVQAFLAWGAGAWAWVFLLGALVTVVAQSSSTVSILLVMLQSAGLLSVEQAGAGICGASFGSGLAVWLLGGRLPGSARQAVIFQAGLRMAGAVLLLALLAVEQASELPLLLAGIRALGVGAAMQLALVFLALQLGMALLVAPLHGPISRLLERLAPDSDAEQAGRPRFLHAQALEDPASALELLRAEQARLLERLPALLDPLREDAPPAPRAAGGSAELEAEIRRFLAALLARELPPEPLAGAVRLQARLADLAALREALEEFVAVARAPRENGLGPRVAAMAEALHLLLAELPEVEDATAAEWLIALAADRGEMMQRLRREMLGVAREDAFLLTGLFERAVWLVRRLALLERDAGV